MVANSIGTREMYLHKIPNVTNERNRPKIFEIISNTQQKKRKVFYDKNVRTCCCSDSEVSLQHYRLGSGTTKVALTMVMFQNFVLFNII